jgi:hypothetical protein
MYRLGMKYVYRLGVVVMLVVAVSACGGSAQGEAARPIPEGHNATLPPGKYFSDEFKPRASFSLNKGWRDPYQTSSTLSLLAPERFCGPGCTYLDFWVVRSVLRVVSPYEAESQPAPNDIVAWLQANPNLKTEEPQQTTIGGLKGVQVDAAASHVPQEYLSGCMKDCLPLFEDPTDTSQHFGLYEGDKARFIVLDDIGGKTVTIAIRASADNFDAFLPYAHKVLDTVEWKGRSGESKATCVCD